jgi:hypothetical protein
MYYAQTTDLPSEAWAASPMNGVELSAQAGFEFGSNSWHSRMTVDLWQFIIIVGSLALLWVLGGIAFRRVNVL